MCIFFSGCSSEKNRRDAARSQRQNSKYGGQQSIARKILGASQPGQGKTFTS